MTKILISYMGEDMGGLEQSALVTDSVATKSVSAMVPKMTTPELTEKLHDYYKAKSGAWAFITQLRNGTGWE